MGGQPPYNVTLESTAGTEQNGNNVLRNLLVNTDATAFDWIVDVTPADMPPGKLVRV